MGDSVEVLFRVRFPGEQGGELSVEIDEVLRVFPSFELILDKDMDY